MLAGLTIRDFAIIESLEIQFGSGMTALTGETGAGKSILVDALSLLLGDRADSGVIRHGAERTEISGEFDLSTMPEALTWLEAHDLAADGECLMRRSIGRDGRSRNYINGRSVPASQLRELGEQLVDIHGQHEHQSLLRAAAQLGLLDAYAGNAALLVEIARIHTAAKSTNNRLVELHAVARDRDARLDLLRHQVAELEALALQPEEIETIDAEHRRLSNSGKLIESARGALEAVYEAETGTAHQLTHQALHALLALSDLDERLKPVCNALSNAEIQLEDAGNTLQHYLADADSDPQRLAAIESRLGAIHDLARKHRIEPQELPDLLDRLRSNLEELENTGVELQALEAESVRLHAAYRKTASQLYLQRQTAAAALTQKVTQIVRELGMPAARFVIAVGHAPERFSAHGSDAVEIQVSANPGQPLQALAQTASGGELSRIALAIEVAAARANSIPTLIFDEVDAGIGGAIAEIVGRYLRQLGASRQVLCVTHLPQVASQAHRHLRVTKQTGARTTATRIESLDQDTRVEELARMLGGIKITDTTRRHAREMMERAGQT